MSGPALAVAGTEPHPNEAPDEVSPLRLVAVLLRERRLVVACASAGVVVAVTWALLKDRTYTTTFSFVPQTTQDQARGGLASIAGQLGAALGAGTGLSQPPQLYADLLVTRDVLVPIAEDSFVVQAGRPDRVPLPEFLRIRGDERPVVIEKTLRAIRRDVISSSVAARTTGIVSVEVRTRSPEVSFSIAKRLLEGVNQFNLVTRQSQAAEERRFTESRLAAARASLRAAEDRLEEFLRSNRRINDAPGLGFERDRLQRDVNLRQEVVSGLAQHYEDARIREVRDTPVITIIDRPALAAQPDAGGRLLILVGGTLAGVVLGLVAALLRDGWLRRVASEADPSVNEVLREWRQLRGRRD